MLYHPMFEADSFTNPPAHADGTFLTKLNENKFDPDEEVMRRILSKSANPKPGLPSFVPEPHFWVHHDASTNEVTILKQEPPDPGEMLELNFSPMGLEAAAAVSASYSPLSAPIVDPFS